MRPNNKSKLDKICLSVFAGQDRIDFEKYKISKNDIDYIFWVANFYPIFASEKIWDKFYSANSSWICAFVPATQKTSSHPMMETCSTGFIKSLFEIILKPFSKIPEIMQKAKFPSKIKEMANKDSRVRIEKEFLKFHVNDKRIYHLEKFVRRYKSAITEQD